jgi:spermidine dehydrogenase
MKNRPENGRDRELGMNADITRRDFLNGVGIAIGSSWLPTVAEASAQDLPGYYPPALPGMRGSHPGSFEIGHLARDGASWDGEDSGETYDLVVVGGGISGLTAAFYYRQAAGNDARILILDNHDDFGGHAKRNEFQIDGQRIIGYGGTMFIEAPGGYPASTPSGTTTITMKASIHRTACRMVSFSTKQRLAQTTFPSAI